MGIKEALEGKKEWRALQKRANQLPNDYRIVYKEILPAISNHSLICWICLKTMRNKKKVFFK